MIEFPLDPALSSLLIVSEMFNCSDEMAIIVAAISADVLKLFDWPRNEVPQFDLFHMRRAFFRMTIQLRRAKSRTFRTTTETI